MANSFSLVFFIPLLAIFVCSWLFVLVSAKEYTRGSSIVPGAQSFPPCSCFSEQVAILHSYFGELGSGRSSQSDDGRPLCSLDMFMTGLDRKRASVFYKTKTSSAAEPDTTKSQAYRRPCSLFLRYVILTLIHPCGDFMNGIEGVAISTIHVTSEPEGAEGGTGFLWS
ncbi:hypothetical protein ACLOJK_040884 [Asimina triloba]